MYNAYNNIKKKGELTLLDNQLIDMLDDQVKEIMEVLIISVIFSLFISIKRLNMGKTRLREKSWKAGPKKGKHQKNPLN